MKKELGLLFGGLLIGVTTMSAVPQERFFGVPVLESQTITKEGDIYTVTEPTTKELYKGTLSDLDRGISFLQDRKSSIEQQCNEQVAEYNKEIQELQTIKSNIEKQ